MLKIDNNTLVKMNKYVDEQHKKYIGLRDECYELERKLQLLRYTRDKINHEISILKPYAAITKNYIAAFGTGFIDLSKVYDKTEA